MNLGDSFDPRKRFQASRGIPGYDEGNPTYVLGVDLLAEQYAGYLAYSRIQELTGESGGGAEISEKGRRCQAVVERQVVG